MSEQQPQPRLPLYVHVKDFEMSFGSMIVFMIKWAIASIPAFIILFIIGMFAFGILATMIRVQ